jgi:GNAT superfamily N-acetyltransferase
MQYDIRRAVAKDIAGIIAVVHTTIKHSYKRYYSNEAIEFFLRHHSRENIEEDVQSAYSLIVEQGESILGAGVLKGNTIRRVFILPEAQGMGCGSSIMNALEKEANRRQLDYLDIHSSLPAKTFYRRRHYTELHYFSLPIGNKSNLDYFRMAKMLKPARSKQMVNLDKKRFRVIRNDGPGAEVNNDTAFTFWQKDGMVAGMYAGGQIKVGELAGFVDGDRLHFHYEQYNLQNENSSGNADDIIEIMENGKIRLIDRWKWESRDGQGTCIMEEE